jgi:DNA-binding transcriptional LysR family regulator
MAVKDTIAGYFKDILEGFMQQSLASLSYSSIISLNHPLALKKHIDTKTFASMSHVLTSPQGDLDGVVDQALKKQKLKRDVVCGVTTFQVLPALVESSQLCASLPTSLALEAAKRFKVKVFDPPVELAPIKLRMIWHQRIHKSPLHAWLRGQISNILMN